MFVCMTEGGARTLGETLRGQRVRLKRIAVKGGDGFLTAEVAGRRFPTEELLRIVRKCGGTLLCADGVTMPDELRAYVFTPRVFPLRFALRTLCEALRISKILPKKLCVGVHDPDGAAADEAPSLLPYCAEVRVCTANTKAYDEAALCAFRTSGACLTVREDEDVLRPCGILLRGGAIFAGGTEYRPEGVRLPPEYARLLPAGVDADRFAAALTECSRVRLPDDVTARSVFAENERKTLREAAAELRNFFEKSY